MSQDLGHRLFKSEGVASLAMERRVEAIFRAHGWPASRGIYYTDKLTGKIREIDVYHLRVIQNKRRGTAIGSPLINLSIICECKSLKGLNIVFADGDPPPYAKPALHYFWAGNEAELNPILDGIIESSGTRRVGARRKLYQYALERAYAYDGYALRKPISMSPPPVDLVACGFREVKNPNEAFDRFDDENRRSPLWNAILSCQSSLRAAEERSRIALDGYIASFKLPSISFDDAIRYVASSLDAELMRYCCYHPFIITESRLWRLGDDGCEPINSARLYIKNFNEQGPYIDIVDSEFAEQYISNAIEHLDRCGRRSISAQWKMIEYLNWRTGGNETELKKVFGK